MVRIDAGSKSKKVTIAPLISRLPCWDPLDKRVRWMTVTPTTAFKSCEAKNSLMTKSYQDMHLILRNRKFPHAEYNATLFTYGRLIQETNVVIIHGDIRHWFLK